jgi:hypothetical protein
MARWEGKSQIPAEPWNDRTIALAAYTPSVIGSRGEAALLAVVWARVGGERAAAVEHDEPSLPGQLFLRPADHVPAYTILLGHLHLARQPVVNSQDARADLAQHIVIDLLPQQPRRTVIDAVSLVWQGHR